MSWTSLVACPRCGGALQTTAPAPEGGWQCAGDCGVRWAVEEGIPRFFEPHEGTGLTETVRGFYEDAPFPEYAETDSVVTLLDRARSNPFARQLDAELALDATVLELGCGTGQLSNLLAMESRTVVGADLSIASLTRARAFAQSNGIRAAFVQMNLFRPCFRPGSFDLVIANGVLHHTPDAHAAFQQAATLVRPGGHLLVGLYHRFGRVVVDLRGWLIRWGDGALDWLDPRLVERTDGRREAWLRDQYGHPHETRHTLREALGWVDGLGWDRVRTLPGTGGEGPMSAGDPLFAPSQSGNALECSLVDLGQILTGFREGGFFVVVARRPPSAEHP